MNISYRVPNSDTLKRQKEQILERIYSHHLRKWGGSEGNVFFISDTYPGVWLEHSYDGVSWVDYMPSEHDVSKNHINIFLDKQTPEGQLPCYIWKDRVGYGWTQECVSIGSVCLESIAQNPDDSAFLKKCYGAVTNWVNWLYKTHMTQNTGLIEMFCGYDTGHDFSARFEWEGFKYPRDHRIDGVCASGDVVPTDSDVLPMLAPDMNACFYGNLTALSKMAGMLGLKEEKAEWHKKAEDVRKKMFELLYDEEDMFFYDVDKNGIKRKIRNISITNVLSEGVMENELANAVFERYILNENEFFTPYPLPAVSVSDPKWVQNRQGNSWNFYSQGLTALRSMRWMPSLGRESVMEEIMRRWVSAWSAETSTRFGQELHPITGEPSVCSEWYSSCMLYYLHSIRRLYGV